MASFRPALAEAHRRRQPPASRPVNSEPRPCLFDVGFPLSGLQDRTHTSDLNVRAQHTRARPSGPAPTAAPRRVSSRPARWGNLGDRSEKKRDRAQGAVYPPLPHPNHLALGLGSRRSSVATLAGFPPSALGPSQASAAMPSIPRGRRSSPGLARITSPRLPPLNGTCLHPATTIHPCEAPLDETSTRVYATRPDFPSPVAPGWNGRPRASPRLRIPPLHRTAGGSKKCGRGMYVCW